MGNVNSNFTFLKCTEPYVENSENTERQHPTPLYSLCDRDKHISTKKENKISKDSYIYSEEAKNAILRPLSFKLPTGYINYKVFNSPPNDQKFCLEDISIKSLYYQEDEVLHKAFWRDSSNEHNNLAVSFLKIENCCSLCRMRLAELLLYHDEIQYFTKYIRKIESLLPLTDVYIRKIYSNFLNFTTTDFRVQMSTYPKRPNYSKSTPHCSYCIPLEIEANKAHKKAAFKFYRVEGAQLFIDVNESRLYAAKRRMSSNQNE